MILRCKLKKLKCRTPDNLSDVRHFYKLLFFEITSPFVITSIRVFPTPTYTKHNSALKKFQIIVTRKAIVIAIIFKIFDEYFSGLNF